MRRWWATRTAEQKRAAIAARNPKQVREQDRLKMRKRRTKGSPDQLARIAARSEVRKARLRGDLTPGPCEMASAECSGPIHAHHEDYSQPLLVRWLCRYHHDKHHAAL